MDIKIELIDADFQQNLRRYQQGFGLEIQELLHTRGRFVAIVAATHTQPFGADGAGKKKGEEAIRRDVRRIFLTANEFADRLSLSSAPRLQATLQNALRTGQWDRVEAIFEKTGYRRLKLMQSPDASLHQAARVNGKVPKGTRPVGILQSQGSRDAYIKKVQKGVGFAKGGWATCAELFTKAKTNGRLTRGIPGWVSRHKGKAGGSVVDNSMDPNSPFVELSNNVRYASQCLSQGQANAAADQAEANMMKELEMKLARESREL